MKSCVLILACAILAGCASGQKAEVLSISPPTPANRAPWRLRIVPTRSSAKHGTQLDCATKNSYFHVVLTNTSVADASVWREWCSWGYSSLSFDIRTKGGQTYHITKRSAEWIKNYADPFVVSPGGHFVYAVRFEDKIWQGFPKDWKNQKVTIRATYNVTDDDGQAKRLGVWAGKVISPEYDVKLYK